MTAPKPATVTKSNAQALAPGYRLGEYVVVSVLGQGGFGITYKARDTKLSTDVAIKEYFPQAYSARHDRSTIIPRTGIDLENYNWGLSEFLKEAQALAKFKHAHIVRVLRFLEANGTAYMVMEYEQGETLATYLRNHGGTIDEPNLLRIFLPILGGLQAVHDAGLLHLDIKPENIYLRTDGQPMLIDFGSSRLARGDEGVQKVMLTPGYCAIEQYPGHGDVGACSDVYSIGASMYRCISGQMPIDSLQRYETFARSHIDPLRPALSIERPFYGVHIRRCIDAALKLSPGERPATAYVLEQGIMGKDMAQVGKPMKQNVYRPGTGWIGVIPAAQEETKKRKPRTPLEKFLAVLIFVATFAIITPKYLIDTGRLTPNELYDWIDTQKTSIASNTIAFGDFVNEQIFHEHRRPTPTEQRPPTVQAKAAVEPVSTTPAVDATLTPYGIDKQKTLEIPLTEDLLPRALGFLKHGTILVIVTDDGLVHLWDAKTGEPRLTLPTHVRNAAAIGISASSQWLAAGDRDEAIVVFDPFGNRESTLRNDPPHPIVALALSANGRLLAEANTDSAVAVWEPFQNRRVYNLSHGESGVHALAFAPNEQLLAAGSTGGGLSLWDMTSGKLRSYRQAHEHGVTALAFSPDGRWLVSAGDGGELKRWSAGEEAEPKTLNNAPTSVHSLAFSPDGHWLIAVGSDTTIGVWNVETGEQAQRWSAHDRPIIALAATNDGRRLATVGGDRVVRLWE